MSDIRHEHDLIRRYQSKDEEAQQILLNKYKRLIWKVVYEEMQKSRQSGLDPDDLYQEGLIALNDAINSYNLKMNVPLYCLAIVCITRKIKTFRKRYYKTCHPYPFSFVSLDMQVAEDGKCYLHEIIPGHRVNPLDPLEFLLDYADCLDHRETKVLILRMEGYQYGEIASMLDISSKKVDNIIQKARRKMKAHTTKMDA